MDDQKATLLREVFGGSSDEENDYQQHPHLDTPSKLSDGLNPIWTRISDVPGLWICHDFISAPEQASFLSEIEKEGWLAQTAGNQAMRFGNLPQWALELSNYIRDALFFNEHESNILDVVSCKGGKGNEAHLLPLDVLRREPLFDQLIVNVYQPGEGICAHADLMRFEDGIAIVSLESPCVMHFTPVEAQVGEDAGLSKSKIPVHLTPGSLVILTGVARYDWKHEINREPGHQIWNEKGNRTKEKSIHHFEKALSLLIKNYHRLKHEINREV